MWYKFLFPLNTLEQIKCFGAPLDSFVAMWRPFSLKVITVHCALFKLNTCEAKQCNLPARQRGTVSTRVELETVTYGDFGETIVHFQNTVPFSEGHIIAYIKFYLIILKCTFTLRVICYCAFINIHRSNASQIPELLLLVGQFYPLHQWSAWALWWLYGLVFRFFFFAKRASDWGLAQRSSVHICIR